MSTSSGLLMQEAMFLCFWRLQVLLFPIKEQQASGFFLFFASGSFWVSSHPLLNEFFLNFLFVFIFVDLILHLQVRFIAMEGV